MSFLRYLDLYIWYANELISYDIKKFANLCSSPLRARASAVSQISRPTKSTEIEAIYYSSLVHYGNLCVVAIANVRQKKYINNDHNINSIS